MKAWFDLTVRPCENPVTTLLPDDTVTVTFQEAGVTVLLSAEDARSLAQQLADACSRAETPAAA